MGSGHFLVAAVDYLALAIATAPSAEGELGVEAETRSLVEIKRRVAERCIWGVDLNPLAVELAKLSIWLATASADKPLSFLDHRLRLGNSLLGVRPDDLGRYLGRGHGDSKTLAEDVLQERRENDLRRMAELEAADPDTPDGVERRKTLFTEIDADRERLRAVLDTAIAKAFSQATADDLAAIITRLTTEEPAWREHLAIVAPQLAQARENEPFHWEIEFPEVWVAGGF